MLSSTISVTYNGTAYTLNRVKEANYSSEFFYRSATLDLILQIAHQLPDSSGNNESHLVTLHAKTYDAEGTLTDHERVYTRMVAQVGKQDTTTLGYLEAALSGFMSANAADILDRAS